jgi:hypothetical protein
MASTDPETQQSKVDPSQDPTRPFYLHPADNPSSVAITPILEGARNYQIWSRNMACGLIYKDKLGFVINNIPEPPTSDLFHHTWMRCNTMIISWITRYVSTSIAQSIAYFGKSCDVWRDMKERFSKGDSFRFSDLLATIHTIRQGDRDLATYFTDLMA